MQTYETTAALGYAQKAYLIRLNQTKNGYDYLCIGGENLYEQDNYEIGKVVKDLECFYVEESTFKTEDSQLHGSFLFDFFLKNYCA